MPCRHTVRALHFAVKTGGESCNLQHILHSGLTMPRRRTAKVAKCDTDANTFLENTRFTKKTVTRSETLKLGRLDNDIHDLFKHTLSAAVPDYRVVEQSARLATRFLTCGVLDRYVNTMIDHNARKARLWVDVDDPYLKTGFEFPTHENKHESLTDRQQDGVKGFLLLLAGALAYKLDNDLDGDAITEQIGELNIVDPACPNGYRSIVTLSKEQYNALVAARQNPTDLPLLIWLQVKLAVTLIHEVVGHALCNFQFGKSDREPYFGDEIVAEPGFEVEKRIFGGRLSLMYDEAHADERHNVYLYEHNGVQSALRGIPVLWEYPCQGLLEQYRATGSMGLRIPRERVRPLDVAWRVPVKFLQDLFDNNFWARPEGIPLGVLHFPRNVAYCFRLGEDGYHKPVKISKEEARYVPEFYLRLRDGDIVPDARSKRGRSIAHEPASLFMGPKPKVILQWRYPEEEEDGGEQWRSEMAARRRNGELSDDDIDM